MDFFWRINTSEKCSLPEIKCDITQLFIYTEYYF
ncbi:unnamed protein product [Musa acuminata subsp. malaccensis]|uniref:(wild Malaysian banana) hypothetical protein n=1 Tax=Musa acuminata subsp. malaccensis TaxID=214687 RepID=A0A804L963_MUSAM|nr:unnamed protein product [Musa acuminata subsp. malaccensis]